MVFTGTDAVRPFICQQPDEIYKNEKIETDIMFGFSSLVRISNNLDTE